MKEIKEASFITSQYYIIQPYLSSDKHGVLTPLFFNLHNIFLFSVD